MNQQKKKLRRWAFFSDKNTMIHIKKEIQIMSNLEWRKKKSENLYLSFLFKQEIWRRRRSRRKEKKNEICFLLYKVVKETIINVYDVVCCWFKSSFIWEFFISIMIEEFSVSCVGGNNGVWWTSSISGQDSDGISFDFIRSFKAFNAFCLKWYSSIYLHFKNFEQTFVDQHQPLRHLELLL